MKTKKRIFSILLICCMVLTMLPKAALAATPAVQYLDSDGSLKSCSDYITLTKTLTTWENGWYVAPAGIMSIGTPNSASRVTVKGDVHLILPDSCNLTIYGGITVADGNSLTIYGQSNPTVSNGTVSGNTGNLTAVTPYNQNGKFTGGTTAIGHATNGSLNCNITINGGVIDARGSGHYPGIEGKNVTINGGYVKATVHTSPKDESPYPSGIYGQTVIINGGYVDATGTDGGAGIGGGKSGSGGSVTISGGTVKATGTDGGAGIGGTFETTASGNAIIKANSITDQSNKSSWSGIIFEGSNGRVYGNQTLNKALTIDNGETLLIGNGATLTTGGHVTNNGAVCVGGTLSGTVSGDLYYPLTVTGGTATAANTKTIDGVTYVKQGDSVTLNPDTLQAGYKFENWSVTSGGVTISNNSFTMPGNAVAVTANTTLMVKITQQPQGKNVTYGADVTLSVAAQNKNGNTDGITYQWYKGSTPVAGETSATLTLTKPNAGTYNYYCALSYGGCTINSNTVMVTVGKGTGSVSITGNLNKTYDGQPAVLTAAGYTVTGDGTVTVEYTKRGENNYSSTAPKDAGDYTVKVTKAADTNYTEAYATMDFTITPKTIGIQWGSTTFTYSGSEQCPTATATGLVGNDTCAITVTGGQTNAGNHTATATALGNGNYKLPGNVNQTFVIAPKDITVTITPNGGVYAGTINPAAAELTGVCDGDTVEVTLTYTGTANNGTVVNSTDTPALAGTYTVTATIADSNYNLTGTNTAKFVVAKANAGLSVGTVPIKTYGDESFKLDVHADSDGKVTYSSDNEDTATVDENGTVTLHNAGTAKLTVEIAETANYEGGEVTVTLTVVRKNATLTVEKLTYSVTYGDADFIIGYASEGESSVTFTSSNEKVATVDKNGVVHIVSTGSTTITLNMEQSGNYNAVSKKVEVIVAPKAITVTADNQTKTYGGDDPKLTYTAVGLVGEDTLTGITLTRADGENAGEYDITASQTNGANPNYEITFASGMLTIAARDIADAEVELGVALIANGKTQEQNIQRVTVKNAKGEELEVTYTVTGNQATELGAYTMTITGTGNFTGTVTKNFVIAPAADSKVDTNESGDVVIGKGTISLEVGQETGKSAIIEMLVASGDLTAEELSLVGDGASIRVLLKVTVASTTITEESKAQIEKAAEGYVIGQYIDISVFKQTICNGQAGELIRLTGTYEEMKISLVVPENLLNRDNSVTRTFWIIRNHDGKVEFLPATFDAQTNTLTFKTDKFSDYAIVYKDAKNAAENPTRPDDTATGTPPQTGDHTILWICFVLLFISCGGMITTIYISKRKKKKFE